MDVGDADLVHVEDNATAIAAQQVLPDEGYNCLSQVTVNKIPYTESDNAAGGKTVTIG